uniref:Kallikrein-15-like n=1 Tax=Dromaius novaehollandiae TaxID=8790 RepID=A0A8C4KGC0_DRONO
MPVHNLISAHLCWTDVTLTLPFSAFAFSALSGPQLWLCPLFAWVPGAPHTRPGPSSPHPNAAASGSSFIGVRLGGRGPKEPGGREQRRLSSKVISHPRYDPATKDGDLMLVKLLLPVHVNERVKPLPLATHCPVPGKTCQISGWGSTTSPEGRRTFTRDPDLRCAKVTIVAEEQCRRTYPGSVTANMVCAGEHGSRADSCQGDSWGPLVCDGRLQGIVSWGPGICGDPQKPGVYVNICKYTRWIQDTMRRN